MGTDQYKGHGLFCQGLPVIYLLNEEKYNDGRDRRVTEPKTILGQSPVYNKHSCRSNGKAPGECKAHHSFKEPNHKFIIDMSREKASTFKKWLDR